MGYVLLWIENLAMAILLVATLFACISHLRQGWLRLALAAVTGVLVGLVYGGVFLAILYGYMKTKIFGTLLYASFFLALGVIAGIVILRLRAFRTIDDEAKIPAAVNWPLGKLATALLVVVALHMMTLWNLDLSVQQKVTQMQAEAGRLALADMPARVSDSNNAAIVYEGAFEQMMPLASREPADIEEKEIDWLQKEIETVDTDDPLLREFLAKHTPVLMLLREASGIEECYFERNVAIPNFYMLLPEIEHLRKGASLLALEARCHLADGNTRGALENVNAMFAIARHADATRTLVTMLVAIAIERQAATELENILANANPTLEQLDVIQVDTRHSYRRQLQRCMRMEAVFGMEITCQIASNKVHLEDILLSSEPQPVSFSWFAPFYRIFLLERDVQIYREYMEQYNMILMKPFWKAIGEMEDLDESYSREPRGLFSAMMVPALGKIVEASARAEARHHVVQTALALARCRAARGQYPDRLETLVPEFLSAVPRDPFDGTPLKYRKTDGGHVVYSIGQDRVDDAGKPFEKKKQTGDIIFFLPDRVEPTAKPE